MAKIDQAHGYNQAEAAYRMRGSDRAHQAAQERPEAKQAVKEKEAYAAKQDRTDKAHQAAQNRPEARHAVHDKKPEAGSERIDKAHQIAQDRPEAKHVVRERAHEANQAKTDKVEISEQGRTAHAKEVKERAANRPDMGQQPQTGPNAAQGIGASLQFSERSGVSFGGKG